MSSSPSLPLPSSSFSSSPPATSTALTESPTKLAAWQPAVYLVVVLVIFAIIAGTILLIWNDDWIKLKLTPQRAKMEATTRQDSAFLFLSSPSTLVEKMLRYFFATLVPAFRHLRQATTSSLASAAPRRPQPALPLYRPPGFREPALAAPRPAMPRDSSSFRVQSNPYSGSEPSTSTLPMASSPSNSVFLGLAGSRSP